VTGFELGERRSNVGQRVAALDRHDEVTRSYRLGQFGQGRRARRGRAAFSFLSASGRFAIAQGRAATLVQVTGGSARRAMPGRGLWAAGAFGVRAITNSAALELRPRGIQVTLLIVDAGIQPLDGSTRPGVAPEALADPRRIADAVLFLANQDARSATHELQVTPLAENWTP